MYHDIAERVQRPAGRRVERPLLEGLLTGYSRELGEEEGGGGSGDANDCEELQRSGQG